MTGKRILITGAAGFIGFHAARQLQQRGDVIIGVDNFNSYYDTRLKRSRAEELSKIGVTVHEGDLLNFPFLQALASTSGITHVLHLAAQAGVRYSLENPQAYVKSNIEGFLNVLELCRSLPNTPLIYASSSSVYGLNQKIPFSVEDRTDAQASFYGVTKKTNELMAQSYHHLYGIPVTGLRFFTVYGPWGRPDMAYFSFAQAIMENRPIKIFNNGNMKRDFTYIDDIVDGIVAAVDKESSQAIFNLGNHHPEELLQLVSLLEENLGRKAQKVLYPMQEGDVISTFADITISTKELGFKPKVSLKQGIKEFSIWFKSYGY